MSPPLFVSGPRRSRKSIAIAQAVLAHLRANPAGKVLVIKPGGKHLTIQNRKP